MILGQLRAFMPLYIAQSGDLDRCYRCLTDRLTTLKDRATQLLIKYKSGALVTQFFISTKGAFRRPMTYDNHLSHPSNPTQH